MGRPLSRPRTPPHSRRGNRSSASPSSSSSSAAAVLAVVVAGLLLFVGPAPPMSTALAAAARAGRPVVAELTLTCADGVRLAARQWAPAGGGCGDATTTAAAPSQQRILCLHGWMDNAASFARLAPRLVAALGAPSVPGPPPPLVVALDLPGHGRSGHRSADGPPVCLAELVFYVAEAARQLRWAAPLAAEGEATTEAARVANGAPGFTLVGHSMGAAVAGLYAAAFPAHVDRLVLLEGAAPLARRAEEAVLHVRRHVAARQAFLLQRPEAGPARVYPDLRRAVEARRRTATRFPGRQSISAEAARALVRRGTRRHPGPGDGSEVDGDEDEDYEEEEEEENYDDENDDGGGPRVFRHDPRLQWPSIQYWTADMNRALYRAVAAAGTPTALLLARDGWPWTAEQEREVRDLLQPRVLATLPGSHHFHADPATADAVAERVVAFLRLEGGGENDRPVPADGAHERVE